MTRAGSVELKLELQGKQTIVHAQQRATRLPGTKECLMHCTLHTEEAVDERSRGRVGRAKRVAKNCSDRLLVSSQSARFV
jgi:hypothetical protein